jgi:hypothetical protein
VRSRVLSEYLAFIIRNIFFKLFFEIVRNVNSLEISGGWNNTDSSTKITIDSSSALGESSVVTDSPLA